MRILPTVLALAIVVAPCAAAEKKLTTDEIQSTFTGNSVHGLWGKTEYYSFFDARGLTTYTTRQGTDRGQWRTKNDQYCSVWQMSGESCYDILRDGDKIIWVVPSSGKRYESTLIPGDAPAIFQ